MALAKLWALVATTGMRCSELAGPVRSLLDLKIRNGDAGGHSCRRDGKAEESTERRKDRQQPADNLARRTLSLPFDLGWRIGWSKTVVSGRQAALA